MESVENKWNAQHNIHTAVHTIFPESEKLSYIVVSG